MIFWRLTEANCYGLYCKHFFVSHPPSVGVMQPVRSDLFEGSASDPTESQNDAWRWSLMFSRLFWMRTWSLSFHNIFHIIIYAYYTFELGENLVRLVDCIWPRMHLAYISRFKIRIMKLYTRLQLCESLFTNQELSTRSAEFLRDWRVGCPCPPGVKKVEVLTFGMHFEGRASFAPHQTGHRIIIAASGATSSGNAFCMFVECTHLDLYLGFTMFRWHNCLFCSSFHLRFGALQALS